ncbi:glucosyltransferase domain-containing protein [Cronobacter malonaticus]
MIKLNKFDIGSWIIVGATALFVLPLMLSGILYQDDILRSMNGEPYWGSLGRPLSDVVVMALGFGSGYVVDAFPLSLIISSVFLCASSLMLYSRFSIQKGIASGIVFSLFSLSPFFLQNLSYHFDCFPMMLGVFLATLPYSLAASTLRPVARISIGVICLVMSLSLYQATINIFLSLCAVEIIYTIHSSRSGVKALKVCIERAASALIGMIIYMKAVTPFYLSKNVHSDLIIKAEDPAKSLAHNFDRFWSIADSLLNHAFYIAWGLALIGALAGLAVISLLVAKSEESALSKTAGFALIILGLLVTIFSVAGPFIFVDKTVVAPRVMMGLPGLMLLVAYLVSMTGFRKATAVICAIPVLFSLSYASAYGNASKAQRSLEDKVFYDIASSIPKSWDGEKVYVNGQISTSAATEMEFKRFPSLKWMVLPLYSWSGMVMLSHYGVNSEMGSPSKSLQPGQNVIVEKRYFLLSDGTTKNIVLM